MKKWRREAISNYSMVNSALKRKASAAAAAYHLRVAPLRAAWLAKISKIASVMASQSENLIIEKQRQWRMKEIMA
jgi:hypothetical protein